MIDYDGIAEATADGDAAREAGMDFGAVAWGYASPEALMRVNPTYLATDMAAFGPGMDQAQRSPFAGATHLLGTERPVEAYLDDYRRSGDPYGATATELGG